MKQEYQKCSDCGRQDKTVESTPFGGTRCPKCYTENVVLKCKEAVCIICSKKMGLPSLSGKGCCCPNYLSEHQLAVL